MFFQRKYFKFKVLYSRYCHLACQNILSSNILGNSIRIFKSSNWSFQAKYRNPFQSELKKRIFAGNNFVRTFLAKTFWRKFGNSTRHLFSEIWQLYTAPFFKHWYWIRFILLIFLFCWSQTTFSTRFYNLFNIGSCAKIHF